MNLISRPTLAALLASTLSMPALATDHAAHHKSASAAPAPAVTSVAPEASDTEALLRTMRDMHGRIAAANTSSERHRLLAKQRLLMQDMMDLLDEMLEPNDDEPGLKEGADKDKPAMKDSGMMKQHMAMMQQMMQALMDQQAGQGVGGK